MRAELRTRRFRGCVHVGAPFRRVRLGPRRTTAGAPRPGRVVIGGDARLLNGDSLVHHAELLKERERVEVLA
jgi:hypothetical protein